MSPRPSSARIRCSRRPREAARADTHNPRALTNLHFIESGLRRDVSALHSPGGRALTEPRAKPRARGALLPLPFEVPGARGTAY